MLSEAEILSTLDNSYKISPYCWFIPLGHPYSYLIDCRLNIFKGENDRWAIAAEKLGYNERGSGVELEIYYYGNCLINLEEYNNHLTNYYIIYPVEPNSFNDTLEEYYLKPEGGYWIVRGSEVELSGKKQDYFDNGIELKEYEPGQIGIEEAARMAVVNWRDLFKATDNELHKSIPIDLKKILALDEWYHKDFRQTITPTISNEHLIRTYDFNKQLSGLQGMDFETFSTMYLEL
jgi:hypothetical protein